MKMKLIKSIKQLFLGHEYRKFTTGKTSKEIDELLVTYTYNSSVVRNFIYINGIYEICSIEKMEYAIPSTPFFELALKATEENKSRIVEAEMKGNEMLEFFNCLGLLFIVVTSLVVFFQSEDDLGFLLAWIGVGVLGIIIAYKINKYFVKRGVKVFSEIESMLK